MRAEAAFESQCLKDLSALGYLVHSLPDAQANRRQRGDSGFPDICFAGRGRVGFIECKIDTRKKQASIYKLLDVGQHEWRKAILNAMGYANNPARAGFLNALLYYLATPDNWDAILEELA